ncbi:MAG: hypothetical protein LBU73_04910 [Helicobacteraceae bacterium]|nr:hypothetical protein [Helicobacteraceae bacterium]
MQAVGIDGLDDSALAALIKAEMVKAGFELVEQNQAFFEAFSRAIIEHLKAAAIGVLPG